MSEVESINPNTPITSNLNKDGAIEADATGGPLSFDELDEVLSKPKAKKETKEPKDEKPEKSKDLTSDTDKGKKSEPKKEPAKKESKEEAETAEVPEKPPRKTIKAKYADSELDIDEEALVPVKINGKEELVQVKDLLGNYSGKVAWDKKFSEIDQTRKSVSAKEMKLREIEDMIKSTYEEQDPNIKMYRMAQIAGVDPVQFREKFFNDNISLLEKWYSMSEDERKADALAYESQVHKHRADTLERGIKEKQDYESLQSKVAELRERHQVSEREFVEAYDRIEQQAKLGRIDPKLVTPEYIMNSIEVDRLWNVASEKLGELNLGWDEKIQIEKLQKLVMNAHQLGLKPSDLPEMIDELWGVKKARNKIEERKNENKEFLTGKKPVSQAKAQSSEPLFFEEI